MKNIISFLLILISNFSFSQAPRLWGLNNADGSFGTGTVYSINPDGTDYQVHYNFDASIAGNSLGPLLLASDGKIYGNHNSGCGNNYGGIFSIDPTNENYTLEYSYVDTLHGYNYWAGGFTEYNNKIYTVSYLGGANNLGALISFDLSDNTVTNHLDFDSVTGYQSYSYLTEKNGKLYGTTQKGGSNNDGVIFEYDIISDEHTVIHHFEGVTGDNSNFGLTLVGDSILYGATRNGAAFNQGGLFSFNLNSFQYDTLISFNNYFESPNSKVVIKNNTIYGLTWQGGNFSEGLLYKYSIETNELTELYSFEGSSIGQPTFSSAILENNYLIGAVGSSNDGSIYKFDIDNEIMEVTHTFDITGSESRGNFIKVCLPSLSDISELACQSYTSPSGKVWNTSGMYTDTISNSFGCDSIISINLTVTSLDLTLFNTGNSLVSNESTGTYQWFDCLADTILTNETQQFFNPAVDGSYAVIINNANCIDTSDCFQYSVSINENQSQVIEVFPNPSSGQFKLVLDGKGSKLVKIVSSNGKVFYNTSTSANQIDFNLSEAEAGMYHLIIQSDEQNIMKKIMIR